MPSRDDVAGQRHQWIASTCASIVGVLDTHPAFDSVSHGAELGEPALVRALLIARIATLAANGRSKDDVLEALTTSAVFATSESGALSDLVDGVHRRLQHDGITGPLPLDYGLRPWSPETTYRFLLEVWSERRLAANPKNHVRRELVRRWGVRDRHWLDGCLSRPAAPLQGYPDIWATLRAESDGRVGNFAALGISGTPASQQTWELWMGRLPFDISLAGHLFTIGSDLINGIQARQFLRRTYDQVESSLRPPITRALKIIEDQIDRVTGAIGELSTLERDLVRERSDEEHAQDNHLAALLESLSTTTARPLVHDLATAHGMWGPLPWWTITVRDEDHERASAAALVEGILPLGLDSEPASPQRLELICRKPRTSSTGLDAHFTFDLTNPVHVGELLVIGRRDGICIDIVRDPSDEDDDPRPAHLGTLRATISRELRHRLTEITSIAVSELLPSGMGAEGDGDMRSRDQTGRQITGPQLVNIPGAREMLISSAGCAGGRLTLDVKTPQTTIAPSAESERRTTRSSRNGEGPPVRVRQSNGFVYVKRNPAFADMVKIGYTDRLPEDRAGELFSTEVPYPFELLYRTVTSRPREVEQAVHRLLAVHRVAPNREFFRVDHTTAEEAIRYCQELVSGIRSWRPMPVVHRLRDGDRITLPLKADQLFVITAYEDGVLSNAAKIVDVWQAHADGDLLELHVVGDAQKIHGVSDNDPDGYEDPVPYLNRDCSTPNGHLIGRERLVAGDRLCWLSDQDGTIVCSSVLFEMSGFCQVTCRTWNPRVDAGGMPLVLNHVTRSGAPALTAAIREVLELGPPRTWAPRNPDPWGEWVQPATHPSSPEDWLTQLGPRRRKR
ncbi:GIY-YIG nuclease family protein [Kutzneria sp. NPDC051319]|uniref:GIY-YIG nuclease family protein n=1 Tax=Kutzneria sp. NPDC051319 TaxID=3155047 RepID=UPI00342CDB91